MNDNLWVKMLTAALISSAINVPLGVWLYRNYPDQPCLRLLALVGTFYATQKIIFEENTALAQSEPQ